MVDVDIFVTSELQTNTYMLKQDDKCIVIDPGSDDLEHLKSLLDSLKGLTLEAVFFTHGHFDHLTTRKDLFDCPFFISKKDFEDLEKLNMGISDFPSKKFKNLPDIYLISKENDIVEVVDSKTKSNKNSFFDSLASFFRFGVVETPGHTRGSLTFIFDDFIFPGDLFFKNGVGRYDLYGGNFLQLQKSLQKIDTLAKEFKKRFYVLSGHGVKFRIDYSDDEIQ